MTATTLQTIKDLLPSNAQGEITAATLRAAFENMWVASVADTLVDGDIVTFTTVGAGTYAGQIKIASSGENLTTLVSTINGKQDALPAVLVDITANRPVGPAVGQLYFDTTLAAAGKPIWHTGGNVWVDATGTVV